MKDKKELTYVRGYFVEMSDIETIETRDGIKRRATITLETPDGQILFLEIKEKKYFDKIEEFGLQPDDAVEVGFVFVGVKSFSKFFNNLHVRYIQLI